MSQWFSDDSSDGGMDHDNNSPACPICGSTSFEISGGFKICSECFTQSQHHIEETNEVDVEAELFNSGGGPRYRRRIKRLKREKKAKTYNELPNLEDCIEVFQYLLQKLTLIVFDLSGMQDGKKRSGIGTVGITDNRFSKEQLLNHVRYLWFGYLKGYALAADYYTNLAKEEGEEASLPRFSLRDQFLGQRADLIRRHITIKNMKKIQRMKTKLGEQTALEDKDNESSSSSEEEEGLESPSNLKDTKIESESDQDTKSDQAFSESDLSYSDHPVSRHFSTYDDSKLYDEEEFVFPAKYRNKNVNKSKKKQKQQKVEKVKASHRTYPSMEAFLKRLEDTKVTDIVGRYQAALMLKLSMNFVVSLLHRALFHFQGGISASHFYTWIYNGELPYFNVYDILPTNLKEKVKLIKSPVFSTRHPIDPVKIEYFSELIWIASGHASVQLKEVNINVRTERAINSEDSRMDVDDTSKDSTEKMDKVRLEKERWKEATRFNKFKMIDNVSLMAERFVLMLDLPKRILSLVHSLMGIPMKEIDDGDKDSWLPIPLQLAHPDHLNHPTQIIALIIMAIKMMPDWENKVKYINPWAIQETDNNVHLSKQSSFRFCYTNGNMMNQLLDNLERTTVSRYDYDAVHKSRESNKDEMEDMFYFMQDQNDRIEQSFSRNKLQDSILPVELKSQPTISLPPPPSLCSQQHKVVLSTYTNLDKASGDNVPKKFVYKIFAPGLKLYWNKVSFVENYLKSKENYEGVNINPQYGMLLEFCADHFGYSACLIHRTLTLFECDLCCCSGEETTRDIFGSKVDLVREIKEKRFQFQEWTLLQIEKLLQSKRGGSKEYFPLRKKMKLRVTKS